MIHRSSLVRRYAPYVGLTIALAGPLAAAARADDQGNVSAPRQSHVERSGWWWNGYRPDVYYSAPPVIYPSVGYRQEHTTTLENFGFPLLWH